jgi:hypothetical protein
MTTWADVQIRGVREQVVSSDIDQLTRLLLNIARRLDEGNHDEGSHLQSSEQ